LCPRPLVAPQQGQEQSKQTRKRKQVVSCAAAPELSIDGLCSQFYLPSDFCDPRGKQVFDLVNLRESKDLDPSIILKKNYVGLRWPCGKIPPARKRAQVKY
jgi:hypothetical protein